MATFPSPLRTTHAHSFNAAAAQYAANRPSYPPPLFDAIRALEEGVGSVVDIDEGMRLGCGHPMGPLTLLDFVGLDTTYYIADIMFDEFREKRFAPPPLLKRMVQAGLHGRKTGKGFYDYAQDPPKPVAGLI